MSPKAILDPKQQGRTDSSQFGRLFTIHFCASTAQLFFDESSHLTIIVRSSHSECINPGG
jgi:hypothetical protein